VQRRGTGEDEAGPGPGQEDQPGGRSWPALRRPVVLESLVSGSAGYLRETSAVADR